MKKISWAVAAPVFFLLFYLVIDYLVLSSVANIKIVVESDHDSQLVVYYSNGLGGDVFSEKKSVKSKQIPQEIKTTVILPLKNFIGSKIRIDPFPDDGKMKIYSVKFLSHFGDPILLSPEQISQNFYCNSNASFTLFEDYVEIYSTGPDPQLILKNKLKFSNPAFRYGLPTFLTMICVLLVHHIRIQNIFAIKDITQKKPSTNESIIALDGLRGFAALLVIADHTGWMYFQGIGSIGVWIFFCLSGFLLSIPFVKDPSLIKDLRYLQNYFLRRIKRILPMYFFVLTIGYLLNGRLEAFIRHIIFIQGDGIYWSVPQEMFFYMILPFVFFLNYSLCRGSVRVMIMFTLCLAVLFNEYFTGDMIYIYGSGRKLPLFAGIFLTGVCLSYFYHSPYSNYLKTRSGVFLNVGGLLLLSTVVLSSSPIMGLLFEENTSYTWIHKDLYGYIAALLILFTIIRKRTVLHGVMSFFPLRAIGIVGFSFYLIHQNVLEMVKIIFLNFSGQSISSLSLFIWGVSITYLFSVITYSLIERPFLRKN